ncbi:hypothetical protein N431DRAFT_19770 [Stipitochalara longipes BDJ]|nr:hypothetical protein N431DRAFT_19770 [Stipitochalara longipes BDJ]
MLHDDGCVQLLAHFDIDIDTIFASTFPLLKLYDSSQPSPLTQIILSHLIRLLGPRFRSRRLIQQSTYTSNTIDLLSFAYTLASLFFPSHHHLVLYCFAFMRLRQVQISPPLFFIETSNILCFAFLGHWVGWP